MRGRSDLFAITREMVINKIATFQFRVAKCNFPSFIKFTVALPFLIYILKFIELTQLECWWLGPPCHILSHLITPHTRSRTIQPVSDSFPLVTFLGKSRFSAHSFPPLS